MTLAKGSVAYIPFWVVLEYLDVSPPDPFVRCTILAIHEKCSGPDAKIIQYCDLQIKTDLVAYSIPLSYLIAADQLRQWADKIGQWFIDYPNRIDCI